jgi:Flp pilus assembly protein TadG
MRRHRSNFPTPHGAVAVVVGIAIFVLVGMIGLASQGSVVNKTELQNAADACALAAARELDGNSDALTRADAAGVLVGTKNLVGFQASAVALTAADISYSEQLSPNSSTYYKTSSVASVDEAKKAKFAMCKVERDDIGMWFMGVRGFGDQTVSAYAVATLAPSQSTCAIPIGLCKMPGGSAPTFGGSGPMVFGKFSSGTPSTTGSYNWIDFDPGDGGGANEIKDLLAGPGQCELPPVDAPVGQQGEIASTSDAWNTRFGIYKGAYKIDDIALAPPDFTGVAYTKAGLGEADATTWPNPPIENAYAGTPSSGATSGYQAAKTARAPYQSTDPAGVVPGNSTRSIANIDELTQYGSQRRVALAPVVDCEDLAESNPQPVPLKGYACVLMLSPIKGPQDVVMEYLGEPNATGSPCSSFGLAGGTAGPAGAGAGAMRTAMTPRKHQRGVAAVEFGFLIIPLTLMLFGLTEYGRAIYQYNTLVKATRDATRYLTTVAPGNGWGAASCLARYGNTTCSGPLLASDLTADMVEICDATNCTATHAVQDTGQGSVNLVTVTISGYQFQSLINFPVGGLSVGAPNITFGNISNTMRQAL